MKRPLTVAPGHYQSSSFKNHDALQAVGLESSIAVALYQPGHGGLAYITQNFADNQNSAANFRNWLENGEIGSVAALVGGSEGRSERLIHVVSGILDAYGIPVVESETLTPRKRNVALYADGTVQIFYSRDVRLPIDTHTHTVADAKIDLAGHYDANQTATTVRRKVPRV